MNRRKFIRTLGLAAGAAAAAPYILPSGTIFARTGSRRVNHVVFCLFAGGIRNIESVHQHYGNLMPGLLEGEISTAAGVNSFPPPPYPVPLIREGTLFKEFRYKDGPTGHFNGHTVALTGVYTDVGLNLRENPAFPTIFEYYRKHNSPSTTALNAWWISNSLGPYPALNFSRHPDYGPNYGANVINPWSVFNGRNDFGDLLQFDTNERKLVGELRAFLDANFRNDTAMTALGVVNTPDDAERLIAFIQKTYRQMHSGQGGFAAPLGLNWSDINTDLYNVFIAEKVIEEFKPELLVLNMTDTDICHQNFTEYLNNLRKADWAVSHLWNFIQSTPGMANDTVLVLVPEHGRNLEPNSIIDSYGRAAIDHTGDPTSREIFCMFVGPSGKIPHGKVVGDASNPVGESIDVVRTIAEILGFGPEIPGGMLKGRVLNEALA
jgi:hypothetical protein